MSVLLVFAITGVVVFAYVWGVIAGLAVGRSQRNIMNWLLRRDDDGATFLEVLLGVTWVGIIATLVGAVWAAPWVDKQGYRANAAHRLFATAGILFAAFIATLWAASLGDDDQ